MPFHTRCGSNVIIGEGGRTAESRDKRNPNNTSVFSSHSLGDQTYSIKVEDSERPYVSRYTSIYLCIYVTQTVYTHMFIVIHYDMADCVSVINCYTNYNSCRVWHYRHRSICIVMWSVIYHHATELTSYPMYTIHRVYIIMSCYIHTGVIVSTCTVCLYCL